MPTCDSWWLKNHAYLWFPGPCPSQAGLPPGATRVGGGTVGGAAPGAPGVATAALPPFIQVCPTVGTPLAAQPCMYTCMPLRVLLRPQPSQAQVCPQPSQPMASMPTELT